MLDNLLAEVLGDEVVSEINTVESAACDGRLDDVKHLLFADPSLATYAVLEAIKHGHLDVAKFAIEIGGAVDGWVAHAAARAGSIDGMSLVLEHGWDVNAPCTHGQPVLTYAGANLALVEYLLAKGANPNIAVLIDETPLSAAVRKSRRHIVALMLRNGGDTKRGQLFHHAVDSRTCDLDLLQLLYVEGAPVDEIEFADHPPSLQFRGDFPRGTPLHLAARNGNFGAVRFLLGKGANAHKQDTRGMTACRIARSEGWDGVCELLGCHHDLVGRTAKM